MAVDRATFLIAFLRDRAKDYDRCDPAYALSAEYFREAAEWIERRRDTPDTAPPAQSPS
jgi:hypothetical protein